MKKLIVMFLLAANLALATDFQVTVTIDTARSTDILALVTAWRLRQVGPDGVTPIYTSNMNLAEHILINNLKNILRTQCEFNLSSCPTWLKNQIDAKNAAETEAQSQLDTAVTP